MTPIQFGALRMSEINAALKQDADSGQNKGVRVKVDDDYVYASAGQFWTIHEVFPPRKGTETFTPATLILDSSSPDKTRTSAMYVMEVPSDNSDPDFLFSHLNLVSEAEETAIKAEREAAQARAERPLWKKLFGIN